MAAEAAESTESRLKDNVLVRLDDPLVELDLTNILAKSFCKRRSRRYISEWRWGEGSRADWRIDRVGIANIYKQWPKRSIGSPAVTETNRIGQRWPSTGSIRRNKSLFVVEVVDANRRDDYEDKINAEHNKSKKRQFLFPVNHPIISPKCSARCRAIHWRVTAFTSLFLR